MEDAVRYAQAGDLGRASALCRDHLRAHPRDAEALHLLGAIACTQREYDSAIDLLTQAIQIDHGVAKYHGNLGNALKGAGRNSEAEDAYRRAIERDDAFDAAHFNLGVLLDEMDRPDEAAHEYAKALSLSPTDAEAHGRLGRLRLRQGRLDQALASCRRAVEMDAEAPQLAHGLGLCLHAARDFAQARSWFRRALELGGPPAEIQRALGDSYSAEGDDDRALDAFEQAVRADPDAIEPMARLAADLEARNRLEAAQRVLERSRSLQLDHPLLALTAARLARREDRPDDGLAALHRIDTNTVPVELGAALHHERGLLQDQMGDTKGAFASFTAANRLQADKDRTRGVDKERYLEFVEASGRIFDDTRLGSWSANSLQPAELNHPDPVFIIGFPRSGTTLLDQVLDSHPHVHTVEEQPLVNDLVKRVLALPGTFPDNLDTLDREDREALRQSYLEDAARFVPVSAEQVLVDKFPLNIVRVPLIWRIFPNARFILALRHPCDVCLSCFMHLFESNAAMGNFATLEDTTRLYATVMGQWQGYARQLPLAVHTSRYEDMVADLEREARALVSFLGLEWDAALLHFYEHARERSRIDTPSYHQVTRPIYHTAVERWRRYQPYVAPFLHRLQPFIQDFGYTS